MTDVLIAGAGPVGLFLANRLASAGRSVRVIEGRAEFAVQSRAIVLFPRTLEALRIAGLAAPFENAAHRIARATVLAHQRELGRIALAIPAAWYDYVAIVPQDVTERVLLDAFVAKGGRVEFGTRLEAALDEPGGVTARLASARGEERAAARFLVGCDGAQSTVRRLLGFGFEDHGSRRHFGVFDVDVVGESADDEVVLCLHEHGPLAIVPLDAERRRVMTALAAHDATREATLDLCNELIGERGPWNVGATKLHWGGVYESDYAHAPGMHKGSMFLAGDAAHVYHPFASQGLNAGLQDAANLAWKLDFALAGFATSDLLPSYTSERVAVARRAERQAKIVTNVASTSNALGSSLRDHALAWLLGSPRTAQIVNERLAGSDLRYASSPIVAGHGLRAPDERVVIEGRERRIDDALGGRYLLVVPASLGATTRGAFENFAQHYGGAIVVTASAEESGAPILRLVRPDGYVALETAAGLDPTPALERLSHLLATHVRRGGREVGATL